MGRSITPRWTEWEPCHTGGHRKKEVRFKAAHFSERMNSSLDVAEPPPSTRQAVRHSDMQPRPWPSTQKSHPAETSPCPICVPTDPPPAPSPSAPRTPPAPPALLSWPSHHRAWPKRLLWPVTEQAGPNPVTSGSPVPEPLPAHPPTRDTRRDAQKAPGLGQKGQHQTVSHS